MPSRSRRGGADIVIATVTEQFRAPKEVEAPAVASPTKPRGKLRRPVDPRKKRNIKVRPPRRNPLTGKGEPYRNERSLMYEAEDVDVEEKE